MEAVDVNNTHHSDNPSWTEVKEDDAVWGVFLKKIRYQRPSSATTQSLQPPPPPQAQRSHSRNNSQSSNEEFNTNDIAHLMWETVRVKVLRAGTLHKIVEAIYNEDHDVQATHLSVFLATYRGFSSPAAVLNEIITIYKTSSQEHMKKTMLDCLHAWLDSYSEDFDEGNSGYSCLKKIILPFSHEENLTSLQLKIEYKIKRRRKMRKSASLHSLRTYSPSNIKTYSLLSIPESHFAQQLTYFDKELFINLRVYECLGGLWKKRYGCASVVATVEQFNALSGRVVSSILLDPNATLQQRGKVMEKWIKISQELRQLKNFSSLKAIVSGLESNPIFRLSKLWHLIPKPLLTAFSQLSSIFSEENNRIAQRSLLEAEGTAKFPTNNLAKPRNSPKDRSRFFSRVLRSTAAPENSPNGTIPYLGTFLTDLVYLDAAYPDTVENGLINFEKRKKEFEILAQLKLLQGSAKGYRIEEDPYFSAWFNSLLTLDDKSAYQLSIQIQQEKAHRKSDSFASNSSNENQEASTPNRKASVQSSTDSSLLTIDSPQFPAGLVSPTPDSSVVVKVSSPSKGDVMYKSMLVSNSDHTFQVIAQAMEKLGLQDQEPKTYSLVQVLPHKELKFPPNANVFYAIDNTHPGSVRLEIRPISTNLRTTQHLSHSTSTLTQHYNNNNSYSKLNQNRRCDM